MNRPAQADPLVTAPPPPPRDSLPKRVVRRLARLVKPLALPILNRMQIRMRSAIDASEVTAAVRRVEHLTEHTSARMDLLLGEVRRLDDVELRFEVLQRSLDKTLQVEARRRRQEHEQLLQLQQQLQLQLQRSQEQQHQLQEAVGLLLQRNLVPFDGVMAIRTDHGYLFAPAEDRGLVLYLLESRGRLEPGTLAVLETLAPPGATVIDVGANVGMHTLPLGRRVGAAGRVLALEPNPRVADLLRRTVQLNGLDGVEVCAMAASDQDGTLHFNLSAQTSHSSVLPLDDVTETVDIPSRRLDTLVPPGERVDLVKIDVEGAELEVWRGMQRIVADNPDIALVLEFGPGHLRKAGTSVAAWFEELQSTGLKAWEIDEASRAIRPLRAEGLADLFSINILLLAGSPSSRGLTTQ